MDLKELLEHFNNGDTIGEDWAVIEQMRFHSREARKITLEINTKYHEPDELAALFSELIGEPVGENFGLFPPFYTDFGKNIHIGNQVFINADCKFQDQGGIYIDDGALIGHGVVLATLNHDLDPEKRQQRWQKIARSAAKKIATPFTMSIADLLKRRDSQSSNFDGSSVSSPNSSAARVVMLMPSESACTNA